MAPRGTAQQCSKCGRAFIGSDAVMIPILCDDCENAKNRCRYCGRDLVSRVAKRTHESACPEMKYFADFALSHSSVDEKKFSKISGKGPQAFIEGFSTRDVIIIKVVRQFLANQKD